MSYFVIKGPAEGSQYLAVFPGHDVPQWWIERKKALTFPDADSAWRWLESVQKAHPDAGSYLGRPVRVNTIRDWKAERAQLRSRIEELRLQVDRLQVERSSPASGDSVEDGNRS